MDINKITNVEVDGVDTNDYPDFSDAYISAADYDGVPMTHEQLDELHDDYGDFVYDQIMKHVF